MINISNFPEDIADRAKKKKIPAKTSPMLATLTDKRFSSDDWIYERKLDGERCLAILRKKGVKLISRNFRNLNDTYPELVEAFEKTGESGIIVDGEIVAFDSKVTSFSRLQDRMKIKSAEKARQSDVSVYFYIFDVLYAEGYDVTALPLKYRKKILKSLFSYHDPLRLTGYRRGEGVAYYKTACRKGWEGIIAKDFDSRYLHKRSRDWLKFKCVNRQELVIGGYTDPQGERVGLGALLVGYYEDGKLRYAGKVGTGYDRETLRDLSNRLSQLERKTSPFADDGPDSKNIHWVTPKLVAEFGFTEWTDKHRLRHPRYIGLRDDKKAKDVRREKPRG